MKSQINKSEFNTEEKQLEFILRGCMAKNTITNSMVNFSIMMPAFNSFIAFFKNEDLVNKTNHAEIILKLFTDEITCKNCSKFGLSISTYYRYKHRYLKMFKHFLLITIDNFSL